MQTRHSVSWKCLLLAIFASAQSAASATIAWYNTQSPTGSIKTCCFYYGTLPVSDDWTTVGPVAYKETKHTEHSVTGSSSNISVISRGVSGSTCPNATSISGRSSMAYEVFKSDINTIGHVNHDATGDGHDPLQFKVLDGLMSNGDAMSSNYYGSSSPYLVPSDKVALMIGLYSDVYPGKGYLCVVKVGGKTLGSLSSFETFPYILDAGCLQSFGDIEFECNGPSAATFAYQGAGWQNDLNAVTCGGAVTEIALVGNKQFMTINGRQSCTSASSPNCTGSTKAAAMVAAASGSRLEVWLHSLMGLLMLARAAQTV